MTNGAEKCSKTEDPYHSILREIHIIPSEKDEMMKNVGIDSE